MSKSGQNYDSGSHSVFKLSFLTVSWFLLIFGPVLDTSLGNLGDVSLFISILLCFRLISRRLPGELVGLVAICVVITILAGITTIFFDYYVLDIAQRAIFRPVKAIVFLLGTYSAVEWTFSKLSKESLPIEKFNLLAEIVYFCIILHGLIMIYQFINPDFRNFIYSFTGAKYQLETYQLYRMAGLSNGGGAQVSVIQSLGFIVGLYLLGQIKWGGLILFGNIIIVIDLILSGRSGFITILFGLILYGGFFIDSLLHGKIRTNHFVMNIVLAGGIMLGFVYWFEINLFENQNYDIAFQRSFDTFINYQETGDVSDDTIIALSEMFVLPEDGLHLVFGRASYLETNRYYEINTDIGYFQLIWGYGIVGLLFHIAFYGFILIKLFSVYQRKGLMRSPSLLAIILISLIIFFNSKELFFFTRMSFQITMAFFAGILLCERCTIIQRKFIQRDIGVVPIF